MMPRDKMLHFIAGAVIAALTAVVGHALGWPVWTALAAATVAGVAKELWDATGRGQVEAADALWTVAGGVPVVLLWSNL